MVACGLGRNTAPMALRISPQAASITALIESSTPVRVTVVTGSGAPVLYSFASNVIERPAYATLAVTKYRAPSSAAIESASVFDSGWAPATARTCRNDSSVRPGTGLKRPRKYSGSCSATSGVAPITVNGITARLRPFVGRDPRCPSTNQIAPPRATAATATAASRGQGLDVARSIRVSHSAALDGRSSRLSASGATRAVARL